MHRLKLGTPLLLLGLSAGPTVGASTATALAGATVVEAVNVSRLLGSPLSVNEILDALQAPAGPGTGSVAIRLASPAPTALADPGRGSSAGVGGDGGLAAALSSTPDTLQGEPVAAVSTLRSDLAALPPSITVAFN